MTEIHYLDDIGFEQEVTHIPTKFGSACVRIVNMDTLSVEVEAPEGTVMNFGGVPAVYARIEATLTGGRYKAGLKSSRATAEVRASGYKSVEPSSVASSLEVLEKAADEFAALFPSKIHAQATKENAKVRQIADKLFDRIQDVLAAAQEATPGRVYLS